MKELFFGPAGVPLGAPARSSVEGVKYTRQLGLGCMELEFVHGVRMSSEIAAQVAQAAQKNTIVLSAHGPYYINLNSSEAEKQEASVKRILDTARVASLCGAYSITFHAAFYKGMQRDKVYDIVKLNMKNILKTLDREGFKIWVRPETTGKDSQFGELDEVLRLSTELPNVMPCIDFSHLHARSGGKFNTHSEFTSILQSVEKSLGREGLDNMHIHISGIAYSPKGGEKNHLFLKDSDMNYRDLLKALKEFRCKGVVISESPNLEADALLMKQTYEKL